MIAAPLLPHGTFVGTAQPNRLLFDLDSATAAAAYHANRLARITGGGPEEEADLRQTLLAEAVVKWRRFNPRLAAPRTFLSTVMARAATSLHRRHRALKRGADRCVTSSSLVETHLGSQDDGRCANRCPQSLRRDLNDLLDRLPVQDQQLCRLVMHKPICEAAALLGIGRNAAAARLRELRPEFEEARTEGYLA